MDNAVDLLAASSRRLPDLCPFGQAPQTLFFDNFEAGLGYWTGPDRPGAASLRTLGSFLGPYATSGANMLWGDDPPTT